MYTPKRRDKQPINAPLVKAIDEFVNCKKFLIGADLPPSWENNRELGSGELEIKLPLEINGEIEPQKQLIITANPNYQTQIFSILITFGIAICRLDYEEEVIHTNSRAIGKSDIDSIVYGPHYHPWELNKIFFTNSSKSILLHNAVPLDINIRSFDSALRWFCNKNQIILMNDHRIEFPRNYNLI